jgi:hypothetical protein
LKSFSKGAAGASLIDGIVTDGYLPPPATPPTADRAVRQDPRPVHPEAPKDGNVLYGMAMAYTFVDALTQAGANRVRQDLVDTLERAG